MGSLIVDAHRNEDEGVEKVVDDDEEEPNDSDGDDDHDSDDDPGGSNDGDGARSSAAPDIGQT